MDTPDADFPDLPQVELREFLKEAGRAMEAVLAENSPYVTVPSEEPFAWWHRLSKSEQNTIDAETENYRNYLEYWSKKIVPGSGYKRPKFGTLQRKNIDNRLDVLFRDYRALTDASYAKRRVDATVDAIRCWLYFAFDVPTAAHRPLDMDEQHRAWSKMIYLGLTYEELADQSDDAEDHIRTSVRRHRRRRTELQWQLRSCIYFNQPRRT